MATAYSNKLRKTARAWMLRRRRSRATKKKVTNRKTMWLLGAILILLLGLFAWSLAYLFVGTKPAGQQLTLDQLSALSTAHRLDSAAFLDEDHIVQGTFAAPAPSPSPKKGSNKGSDQGSKKDTKSSSDSHAKPKAQPKPKPASGNSLGGTSSHVPAGSGSYWLSYPASDAVTAVLVNMATSSGARVSIDSQPAKQTVRTVATFLLPLMILANLFALLFSASRGGGSVIGEIMMFGTVGKGSQKKKKGSGSVTFGDVAGAEEAVAELKEVRDYLSDPERYEEIGAAPPKGVLLFGPPGCGKTLLAKAVAGEAGVPFFSVAGAEFVESLVGVGAARVRDLFQRVRSVAPAIVFIDELDAAGRKRGAAGGGGGGSDEREQTLNQMLVEMDGFSVSQGIVVIGATNRPDILDPALLRPGRFDRHVTVEQPDSEGRQEILELHARGKPIASSVDFAYLARRTPGFSGADLANVINEAALLTVRAAKPEIDTQELEEAIQRVLSGPKRRGRVLSEEERHRAAYHESGHAILAAAAGHATDVHRITILQRGRGLGMTTVQTEQALLLTKTQLFAQVVIAMGGLSAENIVFGEPSTGAEQDLEQATDLARDMVGRFGMGTRRRRLLAKDADAFLGNDLGVSDLSNLTHEEMEKEIDDLLRSAEKKAVDLLTKNDDLLNELAGRLEKEETIEGVELEKALVTVPLEPTLLGVSRNGSSPLGGEETSTGQTGASRASKP